MIRTLMMACVIPGLLLAGCGSVNTYRATAGEKAGKTAYEAQINDALTSIFLKSIYLLIDVNNFL